MGKLDINQAKKVLIVDDSAFMRKLISDFLNSHPKLEVVSTARNGQDAIEKVQTLKPDVVTMDVEMPLMNGLEALKEIMSKHPIPVVMLSSTTKIGAENTILAMEHGAVDFVAKPGGAISLNLYDVKDEIIEKVISAATVQISKLTKVIQKPENPKIDTEKSSVTLPKPAVIRKDYAKSPKIGRTFVMIGTSTGGPRALQSVLTQLPADFNAPILIVQHMPSGFTKSLADRLNGLSEITIKEAEDGEPITNGTAYVAPGGKHLKIKKLGLSYFIHLDNIDLPRAGHRPSVDVLLESAAELTELNYLTVIMTGMGYDGRAGMELLRKNGRTTTIAESSNTSVVYGMPKAIIDAGLADEISDVQDISRTILENLKF